MNQQYVAAFTVSGREERTTNAIEAGGNGIIGKLWSHFGHNLPGPPIAVYSNYASDKDGEYDYLLGTRTAGETTAAGLVERQIAAGQYVVLSFQGATTPEAIIGLWMQIWSAETSGQIKRSYKTDFEIYSASGVQLFVGVE